MGTTPIDVGAVRVIAGTAQVKDVAKLSSDEDYEWIGDNFEISGSEQTELGGAQTFPGSERTKTRNCANKFAEFLRHFMQIQSPRDLVQRL